MYLCSEADWTARIEAVETRLKAEVEDEKANQETAWQTRLQAEKLELESRSIFFSWRGRYYSMIKKHYLPGVWAGWRAALYMTGYAGSGIT